MLVAIQACAAGRIAGMPRAPTPAPAAARSSTGVNGHGSPAAVKAAALKAMPTEAIGRTTSG